MEHTKSRLYSVSAGILVLAFLSAGAAAEK